VQRLMMQAMAVSGIAEAHLDLGHVAVFRALVRRARVAAALESDLFRAMQLKDVSALRTLTKKLDRTTREALAALPDLYGGREVLTAAGKRLPRYPEIRNALRDLKRLSDALGDVARIRFDLAELRGYHYHSGVVFAAYAQGWSNALARGGRYDEVGRAFGRARAATGFSMDLRELASARPNGGAKAGVLAPYKPKDVTLQKRISALRARGEIVIVDLPGHANTRDELGCDRRLVRREGAWVVVKVIL
jgi:ATP phosphoribosyltransferase regulatory subunit